MDDPQSHDDDPGRATPTHEHPMTLRVAVEDGRAVISVAGELDLATSSRLGEAVDDACDNGATSVELDLVDVSFIDSSGVGALVVASRRLGAAGGRLRIIGHSPVVARVLSVTGLADALTAD